jgi:hypothetical protein
VTYSGYAGQRIKGWLLVPRHLPQPRPVVVTYIGYGGGRGFPTDWLLWPSAGYAQLVMDTRGQGSAWSRGATPDPETDGGNPQFPGFMTRGVLSPQTYYYRRVFTDAVRAVETALSHPAVDRSRVRHRRQPGRRYRAGRGRPGPGAPRQRRRHGHARRALPLPLPPRHRDRGHPPLPGDRALLQGAARQDRDGLPARWPISTA